MTSLLFISSSCRIQHTCSPQTHRSTIFSLVSLLTTNSLYSSTVYILPQRPPSLPGRAQKSKQINNNAQKSKQINNNVQKSKQINNNVQKSKQINNNAQKSKQINNNAQKSKQISNNLRRCSVHDFSISSPLSYSYLHSYTLIHTRYLLSCLANQIPDQSIQPITNNPIATKPIHFLDQSSTLTTLHQLPRAVHVSARCYGGEHI